MLDYHFLASTIEKSTEAAVYFRLYIWQSVYFLSVNTWLCVCVRVSESFWNFYISRMLGHISAKLVLLIHLLTTMSTWHRWCFQGHSVKGQGNTAWPRKSCEHVSLWTAEGWRDLNQNLYKYLPHLGEELNKNFKVRSKRCSCNHSLGNCGLQRQLTNIFWVNMATGQLYKSSMYLLGLFHTDDKIRDK